MTTAAPSTRLSDPLGGRPSPTSATADAATQRANMVESQVRPSDVTDRRIIRAMTEIPREKFVPLKVQPIAYSDGPVPLTEGRAGRELMDARVYAKLIQRAEIPDGATVLEIGSGTGYGVAVLARIAKRVVGVESDAALAANAIDTLKALGVANATIKTGPLTAGSPAEGPYDAIIVAGSVSDIPASLLDQLKDGCRLIAVRRDGVASKAAVWRRSGVMFNSADDFDAAAAPLPGFETPAVFRL